MTTVIFHEIFLATSLAEGERLLFEHKGVRLKLSTLEMRDVGLSFKFKNIMIYLFVYSSEPGNANNLKHSFQIEKLIHENSHACHFYFSDAVQMKALLTTIHYKIQCEWAERLADFFVLHDKSMLKDNSVVDELLSVWEGNYENLAVNLCVKYGSKHWAI